MLFFYHKKKRFLELEKIFEKTDWTTA